MDYEGRDMRGFTIVELLIVIVVIGILAAITIISYRGVTNQATISTLQQGLQSAQHALTTYSSVNDSYPATLADAGLNSSNGVTYQYSYDNSATPKTWCVTATTGSTSYFLSSISATAQPGGCPGHGVAGAELITNLVTNPSFTTIVTGGNSGWAVSSGTGGSTTVSRQATGGVDNGPFARVTWNTAPTSGSAYLTKGSGGVAPQRDTVIEGNQTYTISGYVRIPFASKIQLIYTPYDTNNAATGGTSVTVDVPANTWTRLSATTAVSSTSATIVVRFQWASVSSITPGTTLDIDQVMVTKGDTLYTYADGDSSNWSWSGTPNASTSTGYPL